jgi:hypothetical protein
LFRARLEVYIEDWRKSEIPGDEINKKMQGRGKQRPYECERVIALRLLSLAAQERRHVEIVHGNFIDHVGDVA